MYGFFSFSPSAEEMEDKGIYPGIQNTPLHLTAMIFGIYLATSENENEKTGISQQ